MEKHIFELAKELNKLYELSYKQIYPVVENIIINKSKDLNLIELCLDRLLDIPTDKSYILLKKLCQYCESIDKETSKFYLEEFEELYDYSKPKTKKKT